MRTHTVSFDDRERRVLSGAHWRMAEIPRDHAVVDMCACTGEPMERVASHDPAAITYLRTAHTELDGE